MQKELRTVVECLRDLATAVASMPGWQPEDRKLLYKLVEKTKTLEIDHFDQRFLEASAKDNAINITPPNIPLLLATLKSLRDLLAPDAAWRSNAGEKAAEAWEQMHRFTGLAIDHLESRQPTPGTNEEGGRWVWLNAEQVKISGTIGRQIGQLLATELDKALKL